MANLGVAQAAPKAQSGEEQRIDERTLVLGEQEPGATPTAAPAVFGVWDLLRMILVLGIVIALIYGFFHLLRRTTLPKSSATTIQILESQNLSGNRNLHLAQVGTHLFLVGSSENAVSLLAELVDKESIDEVRLRLSERPSAARRGFSQVLGDLFRRTEKQLSHKNEGVDASWDFIQKQKERLKKL